VSAPFTVTVAVLEVAVTGVPELSVTCNSKDQVPTVVSVPVEVVGRLPAVQANEVPKLLKLVAPGAFCSHWQV
jgi:hypothetical protein